MAALFYDKFIDAMSRGAVVPGSDAFKMMLLDATFSPDKVAQSFRSDVIAHEIVGGGYSAGGLPVAVTLTAAAGNANLEQYNFADVAWNAAAFTTAWAVVYKSRGGAANLDELVCAIDLGGAQTVNNATFTVHMLSQFGVQN